MEKNAKKIFVINGANLDMLGVREPEIYGKTTLADLGKLCADNAKQASLAVEFMQYNGEGEIIDALHRAYREAAAVIINAGAYTHYSYAIADAVKMLTCPVVELHLTNIFAREEFRAKSVISPYATAVICGAGADGYRLATLAAAEMIKNAH